MANLSNINNKFIVESDGDVGIGVTTALDKLNVGEGNIRISQAGNVASQLILNTYQSALGNSLYNWFLQQTTSANSYSFQIGMGSTPYLHINSVLFGATAGNIGIGTTSPLNRTHIVGPTLTTGTETTYGLAVSDVGDETKTLILGYDLVNDVGIIQAIDQQTAWKNLAFAISGNTKVGIGTTSPGTKLEIYGDTSSGGFGAYPALTIKNDNTSGFSAVHFNQSTNQKARIEVSNSAGSMGLYTTSGANGILINNSGNVGIGTTSPDAKFQVEGNVKVGSASGASWTDAKDDIGGLDVFVGSGSNAFQVWDDNDQTNPRFKVERAGNVGIGLDPVYKLDVRGDRIRLNPNNDDFATLEIQNTTGSFYLGIDTTGGTAFGGAASARTIFSLGDYPMAFWTNNAERMRIDSIGRMGFNSGIETDTRHYFYSNNNTGAATGVARNIKIKSTQYAGTHVQFVGSQGNGGTISYSNLTASYNTTGSDERLKKNITNWNENILDKFKDIKPKEFHFNQQEDSEEKQKGYIAQNEVDKFPEAYPLLYDDVSKEDRHQFNPSGMVVYLMKAIQELKADNDSLKARIETLENN